MLQTCHPARIGIIPRTTGQEVQAIFPDLSAVVVAYSSYRLPGSRLFRPDAGEACGSVEVLCAVRLACVEALGAGLDGAEALGAVRTRPVHAAGGCLPHNAAAAPAGSLRNRCVRCGPGRPPPQQVKVLGKSAVRNFAKCGRNARFAKQRIRTSRRDRMKAGGPLYNSTHLGCPILACLVWQVRVDLVSRAAGASSLSIRRYQFEYLMRCRCIFLAPSSLLYEERGSGTRLGDNRILPSSF